MDASLKVIVVGNGMVGKTSMITRFARGVMTDNYKKTIGTDFMEKEITVKSSGDTLKLMLWDTAGQEMFSQLTRNYYRGAGAVVYVFSTTDKESFKEIERWQSKVEAECGSICQVLVQNKIDLLDRAQVTSQEVEDLARRLSIKLYRTCVKDNVLVDDVFDYLADSFIKQGGSNAFWVEAVQQIGEINMNNNNNNSASAAAASTASNNNNSNGPASPKSSNSSQPPTSPKNRSSSDASAQSSASQPSFQLTPLTVRTDGKKQARCVILWFPFSFSFTCLLRF